ncbi:MAG: hypothetical protein ACR2QX_05295 [Woeseiaceae bacterium]
MSQFEYVAVLISIIVGLALAQILRGVGRMVTSKGGPRPYWVHLVWTFYAFMNISMFWWWEFRLGMVDWSLSIYLVVITYATLLFFISLLLQPGNMAGINSYKEYYYSRRQWIFGLLIAISLWDFVDSYMKGIDHFLGLGAEYLIIQSALITACALAIITQDERYHKLFAAVWIVVWSGFQYRTFFVIS